MVKDHLENEFKTIRDMCKHYNIRYEYYYRRILSGWNLEKALTYSAEKVTDHLGNEFKSMAGMCRHYNIDESLYHRRIKYGWTQEQALTTPVKVKNVTDHLGNEFKSITEMCKHYNITRTLYLKRLELGWTQEKALSSPTMIRNKSYLFRAFGIKFNHWNELSLQIKGVDLSIGGIKYRNRAEHWDIEVAIIVPKIDARKTELVLLDINNRAWYKVPWNKDLKTIKDIVEHYRPDLLEQYNEANPNGEYNPYKY